MMETQQETHSASTAAPRRDQTSGDAMAAFLAAGMGAFAMGLIVLLNEIGLLSVPALYAPAGGVSGRTTIAVLVWLVSWSVLHARWKYRDIATGPVAILTLVLTALGILATFPPLWKLVS
jgi:hypothetical protein